MPPRVFIKILVVIAADLGTPECPISLHYCDNWLIVSLSSQDIIITSTLQKKVRLCVNVPKSHLTPSMKVKCIGAVIDTGVYKAFLYTDGATTIIALIRNIKT